MRIPIIAGNWKMNKTRDEALRFIYEVNRAMPDVSEVETAIFAQSVHLRCLVKRQGDNLKIGSQNVHYEESGAFTGEVSPIALKELGVTYALIGHSERRSYYNETDESVNKKIHKALRHTLRPIVCVGEVLSERESGKTFEVVERQTRLALEGLTSEQMDEVVIAYEPVWAIGTGKTATPKMANETCSDIRNIVEKLFSKEVADKVRIQYGGSVNTGNIKELMSMEHIDGALVGGASLDELSFIELVNVAKEA
ncbi:triose-phosphate isomerase [Mycoplasmatota bacterium]|nr:triose-phosphate isomerase [Mycoplasmatota bacterium]